MIIGQKTNTTANVTGSLASLTTTAGAKIAGAIRNASSKTGVDFSYLLQQAKVESSFQSDAKACSSSATGLYQFIDSTWLSMVHRYGDKYGLSDLASQIDDNGKVANASVKKQILDLRKDPEICSLMAAEMASDNKEYLESCTGQTADSTDLYMAHFMGPAGVAKFLKAMDKTPGASAADMFPTAAAANKGIFYDKAGHARTLDQVYALFDKKFSIQETNIACTAATTPTPATSSVTSSTSNVLAALSSQQTPSYPPPTAATPLYSKNTSLFSTPSSSTGEKSTPFPNSLYALMSPVDVLELLKNQYTDHKATS